MLPRSCGSFLLVPALTIPEVAMSRPAPGASQGIFIQKDFTIRCVRVVQGTALHVGHRRIQQRAVGQSHRRWEATHGTLGPIRRMVDLYHLSGQAHGVGRLRETRHAVNNNCE